MRNATPLVRSAGNVRARTFQTANSKPRHRTRGLAGRAGSDMALAASSARPMTSGQLIRGDARKSAKRKSHMNPAYLAWLAARS